MSDKRKYLVTGGAGFIGSNLVKSLLNDSNTALVRVVDNLITGKEENIAEFQNDPRFEFIRGDIRIRDIANMAVKGVNTVFHQAALGSVPRSLKQPLLSAHHNIMATIAILDAAKDAGVKRFIYASSSAVYGDSPVLPKTEEQIGRALSPYAVMKYTGEQMMQLYTQLYDMECISLRYFNVYGPKQNPNGPYAAVIPKFIQNARSKRSSMIYGDGTSTRDFTYVDDVVRANILAASPNLPIKAFGKTYNIAGGNARTITDLYLIINQLAENNIPAQYGPARQGDIEHSLADISAAKEDLGYQPQFTLEEGLTHLIL